jgi:3-hydroxy-9,10-secoandrosta-1,3,5(10)-triene-9,17-dione monooxygenase reductase component
MQMAIDNQRQAFRRLFGRFATGVAVVLTAENGATEGLTVNSLTSLSLEPMMLLFCARSESRSAKAILKTARFSVNILSASQQHVSRHFAGARAGGLSVAWDTHGAWVSIPDANATFLCEVDCVHPGGDHTIIVGRVEKILGPEYPTRPLLYYEGNYACLPGESI